MDRISNYTIPIKISRERLQRLLANQKNSSWVLETMQQKLDK